MKDNKLIAEFMGLETIDRCYFEHLTKEGNRELTHYILLKYHTSWDWLMPVMAKLVKDFGSGWIFEEGYDLNTRYHAVVKFIKQMEYKWKL